MNDLEMAMKAVGMTFDERERSFVLAFNQSIDERLAKEPREPRKIVIDMTPVAKAIDRLSDSLEKKDNNLLLIETINRLVSAVEKQNDLLQTLSNIKPEKTPKKKEFTIEKIGDNYSGVMIVRE